MNFLEKITPGVRIKFRKVLTIKSEESFEQDFSRRATQAFGKSSGSESAFIELLVKCVRSKSAAFLQGSGLEKWLAERCAYEKNSERQYASC